MDKLVNKKENSIFNSDCKEEIHGNVIEADVVWERSSNNLESTNKLIEESKINRWEVFDVRIIQKKEENSS